MPLSARYSRAGQLAAAKREAAPQCDNHPDEVGAIRHGTAATRIAEEHSVPEGKPKSALAPIRRPPSRGGPLHRSAGKLFGTDGIRGVVGENLTADMAFRVGQAVGTVLMEDKGSRPTVVIGKDTRISSDMLESALMAGLCSVGSDVKPVGTIPTPAVAYLTVQEKADAGIVISASHNPFEHNGIKIFNGQGYKLSDSVEARIEEKSSLPGQP